LAAAGALVLAAAGIALQNFGQPRSRSPAGSLGQIASRKEPRLGDLAVGQARRALAEMAHDIDGDVVARRDRLVEKDPVQARGLVEDDVAFFGEFARQRGQQGLAALHAAAGKMPAGDVGMAHQQHAALSIDHHRAHA
jgi:hypothetical protein